MFLYIEYQHFFVYENTFSSVGKTLVIKQPLKFLKKVYTIIWCLLCISDKNILFKELKIQGILKIKGIKGIRKLNM